MPYRFPHEVAYLARTKLSYVNLSGILSDAKRDRSARVSGFVVVEQGDACDLVFLRDGDPFNAARWRDSERRFLPIDAVVDEADRLIEHGEAGHIAYLGASLTQMRAMLSTICADPLPWREEVEGLEPARLFPLLRERRFSGVLEAWDADRAVHYLLFEGGRYRQGFFEDTAEGSSAGTRVRRLFEHDGGPTALGVHPLRADLPEQAPAGLVRIYGGVLTRIVDGMATAGDRDAALRLARETRAAIVARHPCLEPFRISDEGEISGLTLADAPALTAAVAEWVTELGGRAADRLGMDPADVVSGALGEHRYALAENGFQQRLPWAVGQ